MPGPSLTLDTRIMQENILEIARQARAAVGEGLYEFGEEEMAESKRLVPVDTGTLRDSGRVEEPVWKGRHRISMELGYGGAAEEYAIIVHEDTEAFHAVGQAKFLEHPLKQSMPYLADRVGAKVVRKLGM